MRISNRTVLFLLVLTMVWLCQTVSSEEPSKDLEATGRAHSKTDKNDLLPRRIFSLSGFRPMMRFLGMMGIPLIPLLLIRQLVGGGAGGAGGAAGLAQQGGIGGGGGLGSMGALGILAPFGMGGGIGNLRPFAGNAAAGGLRPLRGGLRPGSLRPLGNLINNAAGAGQGGPSSAGANAAALFLQKRSTEETSNSFHNFLKALVKLEKVFDLYDLTVPDCQRLLVCEVHKRGLSPSVGSFTEKLIQAFGIEARLERSRFRSNTKSVLKDFLKAARLGLQQKNCDVVYHKCPASMSRAAARKEAEKKARV